MFARITVCAVASGLLCIFINAASADTTTANQKDKITLSGYSSFEAGEIVKGYSNAVGGPVSNAWIETGYAGLRLEAAVSDHLRIVTGGEGKLFFSFRRSQTGENGLYLPNRVPQTVFSIKNGEAIYTIGRDDRPLVQLEAGFFPYKYNPDARNLGEFLFRSYCYPSSIIAEFDKPYADLAGFRAGNSFTIGTTVFHQDLLLTTEIKFWPFEDFSLTYAADFSIPGLFSAGAGVQFFDLFSVGIDDPQAGDLTTPNIPPNGTYYTFAGTKLTARASFDAKGILPPAVSGVLGKEDLKLYGEAAILGLKNYPDSSKSAFYDSLLWRLPIMVGLNLPAFHLCDVLGVELEYQDSPYPNSIRNVYYNAEPYPLNKDYGYPSQHAKVKWSVYVKKNLGPHVSIIGQAARDHIVPKTTVTDNNNADFTDVALRNGDWWWTMKMLFAF